MTEQAIVMLWAVREGTIRIGDVLIPCAVLENGERVLTQQGVLRAIGRARAAKGGEGSSIGDGAPFLRAKNLKPFISNELSASTKPIIFKPLKGGYAPKNTSISIAYGFKADTFPGILRVFVDADNAGEIKPNQKHIAEITRRLIDAIPKIGMIALVDEATGYQQDRPHDELQMILEAYVLPEHRPWVKTIPREFTKELYRVYGWDSTQQRGPRYAGKLTRRLIYEAMPSSVLPELDKLNPPNRQNWQRKRKHFQHLTEQFGIEHFKSQLSGVMALLRASPNKRVFENLFKRAYGEKNRQEQLAFMEELPEIEDDSQYDEVNQPKFQIPDTPPNIAKSIMKGPPKRQWDYLKHQAPKKKDDNE